MAKHARLPHQAKHVLPLNYLGNRRHGDTDPTVDDYPALVVVFALIMLIIAATALTK